MTAAKIADRVFETTTTQGTGTINLAGAQTGFQSFVAGIGDGETCYYIIDDGENWEVGLGTVTSGSPDTLSRDTILESSNSDAAVNWGAGTRNVRVTIPAAGLLAEHKQNAFRTAGELTISSGEVTATGSNHNIDTESDAASDDLDTINGGRDGALLIVRATHADRTVTIKHNTGNILTQDDNDIALDDTSKAIVLHYDSALSKWLVVSAPSNGGQLPVGSHYTNGSDSTNPATILGYGTWIAIQDRMIIGAGGSYAAQSTGGSATTTQTSSQIASHAHSYKAPNGSFGVSTSDTCLATSNYSTPVNKSNSINSNGSGSAMNTISPYYGAYIWERTA